MDVLDMRGEGQGNSAVHYRQYLHPTRGVTVVCVQSFNYSDYDMSRFLSLTEFESEAAAEVTPVDVLELILRASNRETAALAYRNIKAAQQAGLA